MKYFHFFWENIIKNIAVGIVVVVTIDIVGITARCHNHDTYRYLKLKKKKIIPNLFMDYVRIFVQKYFSLFTERE